MTESTSLARILFLIAIILMLLHFFSNTTHSKYGGGVFWHQLNYRQHQKLTTSNSETNQLDNIVKLKNPAASLSIQYMTARLMSKKLQQYHQRYLYRFSPKEALLRQCPREKNKRLSYYQESLMDFTTPEKVWLEELLQQSLPSVLQRFPRAPLLSWNFAKFNCRLESGMPHTIDRYIMLPDRLLSNWMDSDNSIQAIQTLLHELMHVKQRHRPEQFHILYRHYWNFHYQPSLESKITDNPTLKKYQRLNPDGLSLAWMYVTPDSTWFLPIAILRPNASSIRDVEVLAIPIDKKAEDLAVEKHWKPLGEESYFTYFFGSERVESLYHPNEISAELISRHLLDLTPSNMTPALKRLSYWCHRYWK